MSRYVTAPKSYELGLSIAGPGILTFLPVPNDFTSKPRLLPIKDDGCVPAQRQCRSIIMQPSDQRE